MSIRSLLYLFLSIWGLAHPSFDPPPDLSEGLVRRLISVNPGAAARAHASSGHTRPPNSSANQPHPPPLYDHPQVIGDYPITIAYHEPTMHYSEVARLRSRPRSDAPAGTSNGRNFHAGASNTGSSHGGTSNAGTSQSRPGTSAWPSHYPNSIVPHSSRDMLTEDILSRDTLTSYNYPLVSPEMMMQVSMPHHPFNLSYSMREGHVFVPYESQYRYVTLAPIEGSIYVPLPDRHYMSVPAPEILEPQLFPVHDGHVILPHEPGVAMPERVRVLPGREWVEEGMNRLSSESDTLVLEGRLRDSDRPGVRKKKKKKKSPKRKRA